MVLRLCTLKTMTKNHKFVNADVQGTCKYGTRVDYILASPDSNCQFVPGSYSVVSAKGTSDHHIVKVEVTKNMVGRGRERINGHCKVKDKVVRITKCCSSSF